MSNVNFRLATSADAPVLARMMRSLADQQQEIEKRDDDPSVRFMADEGLEERLAEQAADQAGGYQALLVEVEDMVCGCLVFTISFDAITGQYCALIRQLYVEEVIRRQKIGTHLMIQFARLAQEQGWIRIEWMVERLDLDARVFFEKISEHSFRLHKLNYALDLSQIEALAASLEG